MLLQWLQLAQALNWQSNYRKCVTTYGRIHIKLWASFIDKEDSKRLKESTSVGKVLLDTQKVLDGKEVFWRWEQDECLDGM